MPSLTRSPVNCCGLTLVDILVALSLISITLSAGVPVLQRWLQTHTEDTAFQLLFHLSTYARTEAIKANDYFTLCPSLNHTSCGGDWNREIMIFNDSNKNEHLDKGETLHKLVSLPANTPCISWNLPKRQYLQFKPTGIINGTAGHFRFCDSSNTLSQKRLVISFNGRTALRAP